MFSWPSIINNSFFQFHFSHFSFPFIFTSMVNIIIIIIISIDQTGYLFLRTINRKNFPNKTSSAYGPVFTFMAIHFSTTHRKSLNWWTTTSFQMQQVVFELVQQFHGRHLKSFPDLKSLSGRRCLPTNVHVYLVCVFVTRSKILLIKGVGRNLKSTGC
jgi:hypothetical protein